MPRILHFADAHIDIASQGRRDPQSGLPLRVLDFLKALDTIIDTAINEKVELVLFAGDTYKDRTPVPTFQREWGRRIMRLSQAGIPTLLLVGNHDLPPASGRANALQEFDTLQVPKVRVLQRPELLCPEDLWGLPLQVAALPWLSRSGLMAALELTAVEPGKVNELIEERLKNLLDGWLARVDEALPVVLTAHVSIQGAIYGNERSVMLGGDLALAPSLVKDPRLDYVALGHIHKAQNLNEGVHPPVVYPGSIERVDFGEVDDRKGFVIAQVERGHTTLDWRWLQGRKFIDRYVSLSDADTAGQKLQDALPAPEELEGAILRLVVEYPRGMEAFLDEPALRRLAEPAMEFHFIRRIKNEARLRLPEDKSIGSLSPIELLELYWKSVNTGEAEIGEMKKLALEILGSPQP